MASVDGAARRAACWLFALTVLAAWSTTTSQAAGSLQPAAHGAVILLYHHVATDTPDSTSVSPETFAAHLDYLADQEYRVLPLSRIIQALRGQGEPLPPRAVAITFDDGYRSVGDTAAPLLDQHGYPYAVFATTDYVDRGFGNVMSWDQLRNLESAGAEIANHSRSHDHYLHRAAGESGAAWKQRIAADMQQAQARLRAELKRPLDAIAYPYGEFDPALMAIAADAGLVGFGQQSGPVSADSPLQALARFPLAGRYATVDALAERLRTRAFRVEVLRGADAVLAPSAGPPPLRLRLQAPQARLDALNCFVGGQAAPRLTWIDRDAGIVEVVARETLPVGRSKYTCTAPARDAAGVYYWYSHLWMKPPAAGAWYPD